MDPFQLLIESVTDYAIFMLDPQGHVVTWNAGAARIKGWSSDEIIGRHFSCLYPPEDAEKCARVLEHARLEGRHEDDGWRVRKDGSRFWANAIVTALFDKDKQLVGYCKVTRDLTERAEERRLYAAASTQANRMKDEFLATISHELRTPLTAILGWTAIWGRRATSPETRHAVDTIRRNAMMQARIIDDMLDLSRINTGRLTLEMSTVDLSEIARDVLDVIGPAAEAKHITVTSSIEDQLPVIGDGPRLQQVIWNLMSNAVKFTQTGTINLFVGRVGEGIEILVRDSGCGLEPAFLPHVFEPFRQGDPSTTRAAPGLGLGLTIARHIVELHGGVISAKSDGDRLGSTFEVRLPLRTRSDPPRSGSRVSARLDGVRVLVVDDEDDAREMLQALLREEGADVIVAESADVARSVLAETQPHVIVSDIRMPNEDGYSFIETIRRLPRSRGGSIPAIALTKYARSKERARLIDAGYDMYVPKPIDPEELLHVVKRLASRT